MPRSPSSSLSRRETLTSFSLMGLAGIAGNLPSTAQASDLPDLETPAGNLRNLMRMSASLDPEDCPWYYDGTIFAVIGEEQPVPILKFQGMEMYWAKLVEEGRYFFTGNTVSFMAAAFCRLTQRLGFDYCRRIDRSGTDLAPRVNPCSLAVAGFRPCTARDCKPTDYGAGLLYRCDPNWPICQTFW